MKFTRKSRDQSGEEISASAVRGKDGFLFLGGEDHNSILSYLSAEREIRYDAIATHEANFKVLDELKLPFSILVVPEAHVIYDDLLSDDMKVSHSRPVNVLSAAFPGRFIYPEREFRALRRAGVTIYSGNDSHWTEHGAFAGYQLARSRVGINTLFIPPYQPRTEHERGDLRIKNKEEALRAFAAAQKRPPPTNTRFVYDSQIVNHGRVLFAVNDEAPKRRCVIFGTSFSTSNFFCYTQDFSEVVFTYGTTVDPLFVKLIAPDVVFIEQPERFLHFPHAALPGSTILSHAMIARSDQVSTISGSSGSDQFDTAISYLNEVLLGDVVSDPLVNESGYESFMARVRVARELEHGSLTKEIARKVLTGTYRRDSIVAHMNFMISDGLFMDCPDVLPNTELGLLAKIRVNVAARNFRKAKGLLVQLCARHPASVESRYYEDYLRLVPD
jgi:hypothetical protein